MVPTPSFELEMPTSPKGILGSVVDRVDATSSGFTSPDLISDVYKKTKDVCYEENRDECGNPLSPPWKVMSAPKEADHDVAAVRSACTSLNTEMQDLFLDVRYHARSVGGEDCKISSIKNRLPQLSHTKVFDEETNNYVYTCGKYWAERYNKVTEKAKEVEKEVKKAVENKPSWYQRPYSIFGVRNIASCGMTN